MMGVFSMSKRTKFSAEEKMNSVNQILQGKTSRKAEAKRLRVTEYSVKSWIRNFEAGGLERLEELKTWTKYTNETKLRAVEAVLYGGKSRLAVTKEYGISDLSVLRNWISKYTNGEEIKSTSKGSSASYMTKGRKTTFKERIEIVQYTIAHELDYSKAITKYQVSYQQVYSWVRKYQSLGEEGLKDGRGRKKELDELTEMDRLKLENKRLQAEKEQLEMEVAVQKKLREIRERFTR